MQVELEFLRLASTYGKLYTLYSFIDLLSPFINKSFAILLKAPIIHCKLENRTILFIDLILPRAVEHFQKGRSTLKYKIFDDNNLFLVL